MLTFIPKYVGVDSELAYGGTLSHENYNEKLNLNRAQGDYNTEVLDKLLNATVEEDNYHIAYIDAAFVALEAKHDADIEDIAEDVAESNAIATAASGSAAAIAATVADILSGSQQVKESLEAVRIKGINTAGANKYYGTDVAGVPSFITVPELIYAIPTENTTPAVEGIYFLPQTDSVAETMLTEAVRTKLNRSNVTDYEDLTNLPFINGVELIGDVSLATLGIQPAGTYAVPEDITTALADYTNTVNMGTYVTGRLASYVTSSSLTTTLGSYGTQTWVNTQLANYALKTSAAVIQVGSSFTGTPKTGDLLVTV